MMTWCKQISLVAIFALLFVPASALGEESSSPPSQRPDAVVSPDSVAPAEDEMPPAEQALEQEESGGYDGETGDADIDAMEGEFGEEGEN